ncbi:MAG: TRAP transporter large permease subunit, partial [Azonexus sp.]|nr:TRAP transporter large permease subunit [Azonexus sp.]
MQTSFMHPPFGFALFYLRSVAPPSIKTTDIYWGAVPFVCIQIVMVAIIIIFPGVVSYGDAAQQAQAQMERDGTAPPPIDLDAMMNSANEEGDKPTDDAAANLLKDLQENSK